MWNRIVARLGFALLAAALIGFVSVRANDPEATSTTTLEPGRNFVGWVSEPIAVADVFTQIPAADLIYTWDPNLRRYRIAWPDGRGSLDTLEPGRAAMINIDGRRSVKWEQPLTPAKGMVTLSRGVNWVTWLGRDDWPLDQVVRGIGKSLVSIRVGDDTWPAPLDDSLNHLPVLRRGEALQVTVDRDLRWLQPTGMPPNIVPLGDISQSLLDQISRDIQRVVDYFADAHGVETDFSDTTVLVWHGVDAAVEHSESGQQPQFDLSGEALRAKLSADAAGAGMPWGLYVPACWWSPPCVIPRVERGVELLAHEWFHYLQFQIANRHWWTVSPEWMLEGTAIWGGNEGIAVDDEIRTFIEGREWRRVAAGRTSVTLQSAETRNSPWQYDLGLLAIDLLMERSGADAPIEYFRQLHPQAVGTDRRWSRSPHWSEAFDNAFGISAKQFYAQFERWRGEFAYTGPRYDYNRGDRTLRGSLENADGNPAVGFWINTAPYIDENKSGRIRRTHVRDDGSFTIDLVPNTTQRLWLTRDGCKLWLTDDGLATTMPEAGAHRLLNTRNFRRLDLELPAGACSGANSVELELLRLRGDGRPVYVNLNSENGRQWFSAAPANEDSYSVFASKAGRFRVSVLVGGCHLWFLTGGLVASNQDAALLQLSERPVSIEARIPADLCLRTISGRLLREDGSPIPQATIFASRGVAWGHTVSDSNGDFSITVPDSGSYTLHFTYDGCIISHASLGATSAWQSATPFDVDEQDVASVEFVVPNDPASVCN